MSDVAQTVERSPEALSVSRAEIAPLVALVEAAGASGREPDSFPSAFAPGALSRVSIADCFRALRELTTSTGQETFTLSARPMMAGTAELVFSRAAGCANVGEAMREIAHAYNVLHGDAYNRVETRGRMITYVLDDERFPYTRPRDGYLHFSLECALIFVHSALSELADEDLGSLVRRVRTRRPAEPSGRPEGALAFWDAPVDYGQPVYALTYDASVSHRPLRPARRAMAPDLAVHNRIISLIEAREANGARRQSVETAVRRAFHDGLTSQNAVAARLGVSVATLRRRLGAEGVNFRDLHHHLLSERAKASLLGGDAVGEVAEALGFSDTRSFARAFKGWTGMTPSTFAAQGEATPIRA